jgi:hypothetical protein
LFFRNPSADMLLDKSELDRNLIEKVSWLSVSVYKMCLKASLVYVCKVLMLIAG